MERGDMEERKRKWRRGREEAEDKLGEEWEGGLQCREQRGGKRSGEWGRGGGLPAALHLSPNLTSQIPTFAIQIHKEAHAVLALSLDSSSFSLLPSPGPLGHCCGFPYLKTKFHIDIFGS